jgi:hypothetical protein
MIDPRRVNPDDAAKRRLDSRAAVPIPTGLQASALNFTNPTQFWNHFSAAMNENPPLASQIALLLPMFKPFGTDGSLEP